MKRVALPVATAALLASAFAVLTAQQPSAVRAFTGMRLFAAREFPPIDNATMLVRDGRITEVGPAATVPIPAEAERISLAGKVVIPGLINAHGHANDLVRDLKVYAHYGVTTVYSLGNDNNAQAAVEARESQDTPALTRSRIFTAGPVLAPGSVAEARELVARNVAMKVDIIKIRVDDNLGTTAKMPPEIYRAVIDEAHKLGRRVAVHLFYAEDAKGVLDAGADFIAHSVRDVPVDGPFITRARARGACFSPTLMREVSTFVYESTPPFFSDPLFLAHADPKTLATLNEPARQEAMRSNPSAQRYKLALDNASRNVKRLSDAGVPLAMGTDTGLTGRFQGYFEWMELELMVKAGLSPRQALFAATRDAAKCMKLEQDLGTLEAGKWADFVALNADPLVDIANIRTVDSVWIAANRVPR